MVAPSETGLPHYSVHEQLMVLTEIRLRNFRNHSESRVFPGEGITALLGSNGQGKTNLLEAISYLGLMKSFYASGDATVLQIGKNEFEVEGTFQSEGGVVHRLVVHYEGTSGEKVVRLDGQKAETLSSMIGRFPVVVLSPEHSAITSGGPGERRRFLDIVLSQLSPVYLSELLEYRKALRQRNRMLMDLRAGTAVGLGMLEPWTEALISRGCRVISRRAQFIRDFLPYVLNAYSALVSNGEEPELEYAATFDTEGSAEDLRRRFLGAFEQCAGEERRRGQTLVGPHRDDVHLALNGMRVADFASQGQHKSLLVAMKVAEFFFLRDHRGEPPVLLLDDVFSELDEFRTGNILRLMMDIGQTVITATSEAVFHGQIPWNGHHRRVFVEHGTCRAA